MAYRRWTRARGVEVGGVAADAWYWRCGRCRRWAGSYADTITARQHGAAHLLGCVTVQAGYTCCLEIPQPGELIPALVRGFTRWTVRCGPEGSCGRRIGLVAFDYGIPAAARRGRGQWICLLSGAGEEPPLAYLQHVRTPEQAVREIARAYQAWLPARQLPRRAACPPPAPRRTPRRRGRT